MYLNYTKVRVSILNWDTQLVSQLLKCIKLGY